jgi:hypothetical protein
MFCGQRPSSFSKANGHSRSAGAFSGKRTQGAAVVMIALQRWLPITKTNKARCETYWLR